jgi:hypothetical protein
MIPYYESQSLYNNPFCAYGCAYTAGTRCGISLFQ